MSEISLLELKSRCWQGWFPRRLRGTTHPLPLSASLGLWLSISASVVTSLSSTTHSDLLSFSCKGPCDYARPTWII